MKNVKKEFKSIVENIFPFHYKRKIFKTSQEYKDNSVSAETLKFCLQRS